MRKILLLLFIGLGISGVAQELQATVSINTPKLQTADPKVFKTLETALLNLINNTKWTEDVFETSERIQCSFTLNIKEELSAKSFKAELLIQARRPIYGSSEETVMFAHADKEVTFIYEEFQPVDFVRNSFSNNLTSIVSFYAYVILGLDYDSFSSLGGSDNFQAAQDILSNVPSGAGVGWASIDGQRNRYWLIENILSPRVLPLRKGLYTYHRQGLDRMFEKPDEGRASIASVIKDLKTVNRNYPNSMIMQTFANTKSNEIVSIFGQATQDEKNTVYSAMIKIDAANASKYRKIRR